MKLSELITKQIKTGNTVRAGHNGAWRAVQVADDKREIWHYGTLMALANDGTLVQVSAGWGSVSDKAGMRKMRAAADRFVDGTALVEGSSPKGR